MSQFDLNKPVDFAKLTVGSTSGLLQSFLGKDPAEWDLVEGSYKAVDPANPNTAPVLFHIFKSSSQYQGALSSVHDQGGRRKAKYVYPYVDGQTTDDLGRKPQRIVLDIVIFGNNYKIGLNALLNELNKPFPGVLRHPVRGDISCVMEEYELVHSAEQRKAVGIHVVLEEHNFSIGSFAQQFQDNSTKSALASCLAFLQKIQNIATRVSGTLSFVESTKQLIKQSLAEYQYQFGLNLQRINTTFNNGSSTDLPALLPVNQGGTANTSQSTFPVVAQSSDPFAASSAAIFGQPSQQLTAALAAVQAVNNLNALRDQAKNLIQQLETAGGGVGALEFYDEILQVKQSVIAIQDALEKGIQSSRASLVSFVTPRLMTIREIAFENGISVDRVQDIEILNASTLLSANYVPAGTTVLVPIS